MLGPEHEIVKDQLYNAYAAFGESNGIFYHNTDTPFFRDLYARYPDLKATKCRDGLSRIRKVKGIDLRDDE